MTTDTEDRVKQCIARMLGVPESGISNGASFAQDLAADSLDLIELVMELESEFAILINDEESADLLTVQQAIDFVAARVETGKA